MPMPMMPKRSFLPAAPCAAAGRGSSRIVCAASRLPAAAEPVCRKPRREEFEPIDRTPPDYLFSEDDPWM